MAIIAHVGVPGSGKTYRCIEKLLDNLKKGRKIYVNVDGLERSSTCREAIKTCINISDSQLDELLIFLDTKQTRSFWEYAEQGSMVVIDEVQRYFSNRDWNTKENKSFAEWCSVHRHHGFDVLLITQSIERIDSAVRNMIEWTYDYRKINFFGSAVKNKYIEYAYCGAKEGKPLGKNIRSYDPAIFACYKSYVTKNIKELGIQKHKNILAHPVFYSIPVVLLLVTFMFFKTLRTDNSVIGTLVGVSSFDVTASVKEKTSTTSEKRIDPELFVEKMNNMNSDGISPGRDGSAGPSLPGDIPSDDNKRILATMSDGRIFFTSELCSSGCWGVQ